MYFPYTLFLENLVFPSKFYTQTSVEFGTTRSFPAKCWAGAARTADYAPQGYFSGAAKLKKRGFVLDLPRSGLNANKNSGVIFRNPCSHFRFCAIEMLKELNQVCFGMNVLKKKNSGTLLPPMKAKSKKSIFCGSWVLQSNVDIRP